jgi:hypothetical protein
MNQIIVSFLTLFLFSKCGINKPVVHSEKEIRIEGSIQVHSPYCGGAYPTPEMEKGYDEPVKNASYTVCVGTELNAKTVKLKTFETSETGEFLLNLSPGIYMIVNPDKFLPLHEFKKKNSLVYNQFTKVNEDACFEKWKNTPDFLLQVVADTQVVWTYQKRCFVGNNPCLTYEGPLPP